MKFLCKFAKDARHREGCYDLAFILRSVLSERFLRAYVKALRWSSQVTRERERKTWSEFFHHISSDPLTFKYGKDGYWQLSLVLLGQPADVFFRPHYLFTATVA
jgi:hypothetical protein